VVLHYVIYVSTVRINRWVELNADIAIMLCRYAYIRGVPIRPAVGRGKVGLVLYKAIVPIFKYIREIWGLHVGLFLWILTYSSSIFHLYDC